MAIAKLNRFAISILPLLLWGIVVLPSPAYSQTTIFRPKPLHILTTQMGCPRFTAPPETPFEYSVGEVTVLMNVIDRLQDGYIEELDLQEYLRYNSLEFRNTQIAKLLFDHFRTLAKYHSVDSRNKLYRYAITENTINDLARCDGKPFHLSESDFQSLP
jgi:hypothetical protein